MIILLMGVAGAGKTTIGELLARKIGWFFEDADDLHPAANREKMHRGAPLTDEDRAPWLAAVRALIGSRIARGENAVIACSALKQAYRDEIIGGETEVKVIYLKGEPELINERIAKRSGHFFNPGLLASQFDDLEEPADGLIEDTVRTPDQIIKSIVTRLELRPSTLC